MDDDVLRVAGMLDGIEYEGIGVADTWHQAVEVAKKAGVVILFGMSDDLLEADGAIKDEADAYEGRDFLLSPEGIVLSWEEFIDWNGGEPDEVDARVYFRDKDRAVPGKLLWHEEGDDQGFAWTFDLGIPHTTFRVLDEGEPFCLGVAFRVADIQPPALAH